MDPAHALPDTAVRPTPRTNGASRGARNGSPNGTTNGATPAKNGASSHLAPTMPATNPSARPAENRDLAEVLRRSLDDARGNPQIRERLEQLAKDTARVEQIVRTLGPRHAVVRELSRLRAQPAADTAA